MGTSTFSEYPFLACRRSPCAKISNRAPLEKVVPAGCGVPPGIGAVLNTAKVEAGATLAVFVSAASAWQVGIIGAGDGRGQPDIGVTPPWRSFAAPASGGQRLP